MGEPHLTAEDERIWAMWRRVCLAHARTSVHRRRVERARREVLVMAERCPDAYVGWSAGKDSTALMHLVRVECGVAARAMAVKDDLDFPGEVAYLQRYATEWGVSLHVLYPPFSLQQWLRDHPTSIGDDLHSRGSAFSDAAFYDLIEAFRLEHGTPGVYLGLRKDESRGRLLNRARRGLTYRKKSGEVVCQPIADWSGLDVHAYLLSRNIEMLHVYRCVRFAESPDRIRKSWWVMGEHVARGAGVWLKSYYPSLWDKLRDLIPDAGQSA